MHMLKRIQKAKFTSVRFILLRDPPPQANRFNLLKGKFLYKDALNLAYLHNPNVKGVAIGKDYGV